MSVTPVTLSACIAGLIMPGETRFGFEAVSLRFELFGCAQPRLPNPRIAGTFCEFPVPRCEVPQFVCGTQFWALEKSGQVDAVLHFRSGRKRLRHASIGRDTAEAMAQCPWYPAIQNHCVLNRCRRERRCSGLRGARAGSGGGRIYSRARIGSSSSVGPRSKLPAAAARWAGSQVLDVLPLGNYQARSALRPIREEVRLSRHLGLSALPYRHSPDHDSQPRHKC